MESESGRQNSLKNPPIGKTLFERALGQHIQRNFKRPPADLLSSAFSGLRNQITALRKKGVEFVFFEMPIDKRVSNLIRPQLVKRYALHYFPPGENKWIFPPAGKDYPTTDGVHLNGKSSKVFTSYFKSKIE